MAERDYTTEDLMRLRRQQYTYRFGGGTVGGDIWNWRQPSYIERLGGQNELIPELRPELRGRVNVMPAGRGSAQELQSMREAGGRPYVEAPELYRRGGGTSQLDRSNQFYSTVTGRPMGTLMGLGEYSGFNNEPIQGPDGQPLGKYSPQMQRRRSKKGKNPYGAERGGYSQEYRDKQKDENLRRSAGGAQAAVEMQPEDSIFDQRGGLGYLTGFGGIPLFPYTNY